MPNFKKLPDVVSAVQFTGSNADECLAFVGPSLTVDGSSLLIAGLMKVSVNDWIIRGAQGEFYPCKPDVFATSYESVD